MKGVTGWANRRAAAGLGWLGHAGRAHPVLCVFLVAFFVRFAAAAAVSLAIEESILLDDAGYSGLAADKAAGIDASWDSERRGYYERNEGFLLPLALVYEVTGPVALAGQWFVALVGALTAALTARLALEAIEPIWALVAGLIVALLPSQIFFSSLTLKDAFVWAGTAAIGLCIALSTRWRHPGHLLLLVATITGVFAAGTRIRPHSVILALWVLAIVAFVPEGRARLRAIGSSLLVAFVPVCFGLGIAGVGYVLSLNSIEGYRDAQASGNLPLLTPTTIPPIVGTPEPAGPAPPGEAQPGGGETGGGETGGGETGGGETEPSPTQGPDSPIAPSSAEPPPVTEDNSRPKTLRHLPRGISAALLEPFPWQSSHNLQYDLAKLEMVVWYPLLGLSLAGAWSSRAGGSKAARVLLFPLLFGAATLMVSAVTEGNFGTAYRHRGQLVWIVGLFAAIGFRHICMRRAGTTAPVGVVCAVEHGPHANSGAIEKAERSQRKQVGASPHEH